MFHIFLSVILFLECVSSQCAGGTSYCLSGLSVDDYASFIAGYYEYVSLDEGCKYFRHTQLPKIDYGDGNIYLHWDAFVNQWIINYDLVSTDYYAYCEEYYLDDCVYGEWYHYDGISTSIHDDITIQQCSYNNSVCLEMYVNKSSDQDDICLRNTYHREVNRAISGSYSLIGCSEEQPYYTHDNEVTVNNITGSILTIAWDNELSSWYLGRSHSITAGWVVAYCEYDDILDCSGKWYIYDGEGTSKDSQVVSGLCSTCTDTKYDDYCIYGGINSESGYDFIVGIYEWNICYQLMSSYVHNMYDVNLTLHYKPYTNTFYIDINYNDTKTVAVCLYEDDILECDGNWTIYNAENEEWSLQTTTKSGLCDVIYEQCIDDSYLCINLDENDDTIIDNVYYLQYIAGEYKYFDCDDNGFPVFIRNKDNDGNEMDLLWNNITMISFDIFNNIFSLHDYIENVTDINDSQTYNQYLYCRSLLIDLCDTFWNIYDSNQWVSASSIKLSNTTCPYPSDPVDNNNTPFIDLLKHNSLYIIIGLIALLLCCCIIVLFYCCKQCKSSPQKQPKPVVISSSKPYYQPTTQNTPTTSQFEPTPQFRPTTTSTPQFRPTPQYKPTQKYRTNVGSAYSVELQMVNNGDFGNDNVEGEQFDNATFGNPDAALNALMNNSKLSQ